MSYLGFLMLFSYVTLVKMEDKPSVQEWLVIVYILSTAVEKTREACARHPSVIIVKCEAQILASCYKLKMFSYGLS